MDEIYQLNQALAHLTRQANISYKKQAALQHRTTFKPADAGMKERPLLDASDNPTPTIHTESSSDADLETPVTSSTMQTFRTCTRCWKFREVMGNVMCAQVALGYTLLQLTLITPSPIHTLPGTPTNTVCVPLV
jgi:hypothetical protein